MKVIVIADDFTGALDTATQFSKIGIPTIAYPSAQKELPPDGGDICVTVVNSESRHLQPAEAYRRVYTLSRWAIEQGASILYKKTDSALRGNIGSELQAMSDAGGDSAPIYFLPGYPRSARTTINGVQYYNGTPVAESVFGRDPLEPVAHSDVQKILATQTSMDSRVVKRCSAFPDYGGRACIYICDSQEDADIQSVCRRLPAACPETPLLLAGCAGFAEYVAKDLLLELSCGRAGQPPPPSCLLIVSGSLNDITAEQLRYGKEQGIPSFLLHEDTELAPGYVMSPACRSLSEQVRRTLRENQVVILETAGVDNRREAIPKEEFVNISEAIAMLVQYILSGEEDYAVAVFGGDTLQAVIERLFPSGIVPQGEVEVGVPVAYAMNHNRRNHVIISKSGGLGQRDVIVKIMRFLRIAHRDGSSG